MAVLFALSQECKVVLWGVTSPHATCRVLMRGPPCGRRSSSRGAQCARQDEDRCRGHRACIPVVLCSAPRCACAHGMRAAGYCCTLAWRTPLPANMLVHAPTWSVCQCARPCAPPSCLQANMVTPLAWAMGWEAGGGPGSQMSCFPLPKCVFTCLYSIL